MFLTKYYLAKVFITNYNLKLQLNAIRRKYLGTIGNTPLVKLNRVIEGVDALVLAKVETFNPGNCKDRMAVKMIADAEADGRLKPGGTS
jgi:cysteine synthase